MILLKVAHDNIDALVKTAILDFTHLKVLKFALFTTARARGVLAAGYMRVWRSDRVCLIRGKSWAL